MVHLCHSNDFGLLQLCSQFAIRVLALLFAFQLATYFERSMTYSETLKAFRSNADDAIHAWLRQQSAQRPHARQ
jgi:hypothetical protein